MWEVGRNHPGAAVRVTCHVSHLLLVVCGRIVLVSSLLLSSRLVFLVCVEPQVCEILPLAGLKKDLNTPVMEKPRE